MTTGLSGDGIAAIISAAFAGLTTLISSLNRRTATTTESKVDTAANKVADVQRTAITTQQTVEDVHSEVKTENGHTLAELVETKLVPTVESVAAATVPEQSKSPAPE